MISFTVLGGPVAQPRQRVRVAMIAGRAMAMNYTPTDSPVNAWKAQLKHEAVKVMPKQPWTGPVSFEAKFFLPRPANLSRKKDPENAVWHCGSKDIDNLYKSVADALTGLIYKDDRQICQAAISKLYHEKDGRPRVEITLRQL